MNLSANTKVTRCMNAVAAGTTSPQEGSVIDMQGFDGVMFVALFGALTAGAVTGLVVQQGDESDGSDMSDLEGTALAIADDEDNKVLISDLYRPTKRYVQCNITRATQNAVIDGLIAVQYGSPLKVPTTHDAATVAGAETHVSPDEGTA